MDSNQGNIKGVVIIKLPPPEGPSAGKSIVGALTFTNDEGHGTLTQEEEVGLDGNHPHLFLPLHHNQPPSLRRPRRRFLRPFRSKRVACILFLAVVGYFFYQYAPLSLKLEEDDDSNSEQSERLMVYQVYSRIGVLPTANSSLAAESIPTPTNKSAPISPSVASRLVVRDIVYNNKAETAPPSNEKGTYTTVFPLRGNVYPSGLYYVSVAVGNPPREYYLDMDTGSDLTWLQCDAPCTHCAKGPHPLYKPKKTNLVDCAENICSSVQVGGNFGCKGGSGQCDYEIMYADSGYSLGVLVSDTMTLRLSNRSLTQTKAVFGCAYDQQGSLGKSPSVTDGVLGLSSSMVSLPSQWAAQGLIKNIIAHCISGDGRGGGYLFFGDKLVPRGITWAPMLKKAATKHYTLAVINVYFGEAKISIDGNAWGSSIFDSGTSYTYLVSSVYAAVVSTISNNLIGSGLEQDPSDDTLHLCWRGSSPFQSLDDAQLMFKSITLEFNGSGWFSKSSKLQISPQGYLIVNSKGNICLGILNADVLGNHGANIIGDISMQGHLVVYDNENNRLGWKKSDCRKIPNTATLSPSL